MTSSSSDHFFPAVGKIMFTLYLSLRMEFFPLGPFKLVARFCKRLCYDIVCETKMFLIEFLKKLFVIICRLTFKLHVSQNDHKNPVPISVNYHLTRACNYRCKFCFHTQLTKDFLPLNEAKRGLRLLQQAGTKKINFSGGEPFLIDHGRYVGELTRFAKEECKMATSIVSNGSLIKENWFENYSKYLDILAISCDSFDNECNKQAGRTNGQAGHSQVNHVLHVRHFCEKYGVVFKINSVIHALNYQEDMIDAIERLDPVRWKVFQCLLIDGENMGGENNLRDARELVIADEQFEQFCQRHQHLKCFVPESNVAMRNSYLILDERMRFLDCTKGRKDPSLSILDVGVESALDRSGFDEEMFFKRGGQYKWTKDAPDLNDW